jgi:hypothetical protein
MERGDARGVRVCEVNALKGGFGMSASHKLTRTTLPLAAALFLTLLTSSHARSQS